jgi:hypothetical protein
LAATLVSERITQERDEVAPAIKWLGEQYHSEWRLLEALKRGIGIHHGKMPRALQQYIVRKFNEGVLDFLICTSTLIEGVNTRAKNVIVYDNKIASEKLSFFDFSNIRGRSGRMGRYFTGRVYLFSPEPADDSPDVEIPLVEQELASPSLLLQINEADLTDAAKIRIRPFLEQELVSVETLRANRGIQPENQIALATHIRSDIERYFARLNWTSMPTTPQLQTTCELIWRFLVPEGVQSHGVKSGKQLALKIGQLRALVDNGSFDIRTLIVAEILSGNKRRGMSADEAVEEVLDFLRYWATYHFPRFLMALHRIQTEILTKEGFPSGDYTTFAAQVENLFSPPGLVALDEYGVPLQIGLKLNQRLSDTRSLDAALRSLKELDINKLDLDPFEWELLNDAKAFI